MRMRRAGIQGFTLVEMLVVLVILGLIVGLVGPRVLNYLTGARADTAQVQLQQLYAAAQLYTLDIGEPPPQEAGLDALVSAPAGVDGWSGPYLDGDTVPLDPWGNPFSYELDRDTGRFRVISLGADGVQGGEGADADLMR
ncbi:type II secretion system major pseudopilin GspG [uncultured Roseobacter sp.]|uniref:type II secretion system major pseudopilin GspG n=1 Tax=uncultured Roseobacter sp. TaxID=114847 RepID=UPI00261E838C|nr:type II secretion system major pseudopilin GspG [uncultured Roseobacter sp.]